MAHMLDQDHKAAPSGLPGYRYAMEVRGMARIWDPGAQGKWPLVARG